MKGVIYAFDELAEPVRKLLIDNDIQVINKQEKLDKGFLDLAIIPDADILFIEAAMIEIGATDKLLQFFAPIPVVIMSKHRQLDWGKLYASNVFGFLEAGGSNVITEWRLKAIIRRIVSRQAKEIPAGSAS